MDDRFYDLCYEAWMKGKNPDDVSIERYDNMRAQGYYPDEIGLRNVLPPKRKPQGYDYTNDTNFD